MESSKNLSGLYCFINTYNFQPESIQVYSLTQMSECQIWAQTEENQPHSEESTNLIEGQSLSQIPLASNSSNLQDR